MIVEDDNISIADTEDAFDAQFLRAKGHETLDTVLARMLKQKQHLAMVYNRGQKFIGIITLEDIIEEIIQVEIEDEDDAENGE